MSEEQALVRARRSFKGATWESIQHPEDRAALDTLKQIPMLDKVVAFIMQHGWERMLYIENISSSVKVSPRQCPRVWYLFSEVNRILGVDEPIELYITQDPLLNAYSIPKNRKLFPSFALLKGRLTTTAATRWPEGARAACFCPDDDQAVATGGGAAHRR